MIMIIMIIYIIMIISKVKIYNIYVCNKYIYIYMEPNDR